MTLADGAPKAQQYFVDALDVYASLCYHFGRYAVSEDKTHMFFCRTHHAELHQYLARLARSSRYFSRHLYAFVCALRLFIYYFDHRQLKEGFFTIQLPYH